MARKYPKVEGLTGVIRERNARDAEAKDGGSYAAADHLPIWTGKIRFPVPKNMSKSMLAT